MVFDNSGVVTVYTMTDTMFICGWIVACCVGLGITLWWGVIRKKKVKPRIAICVKCKYVIKTKWYHAQIMKVRCRTPDDPAMTNFITGQKVFQNFSCTDRNLYGTCARYERKGWG